MKPQTNQESAQKIRQVGVRELRQDASGILREVKGGECFEITEHGRPIARIVPIGPSLYEEAVNSGLIIAPTIPSTQPLPPLVKVASGLNSTKVLMEMRAEERS
jgi:prevent-host-death family protein